MTIRLRSRRSVSVHCSIAAALAAAAVTFSGQASAFNVKKTPTGVDIHWKEPSVTYHLDASVAESATGAAAAIATAASGWSGLESAPSLSVVQGGGGSAPGYDGINTIFFAPHGSPYAGGALAVTVLTFDENGTALDADIVINGRYPFAVLPAGSVAAKGAQPVSNEGALLTPSSAPFDLLHVSAHELGHSLGLADETDDNTALMFLYSAPGAASPRAPESDDSSGIASLYDTGTSSGHAGCSGAAVSPRTPTHGASRVAFALILGLIAWAIARRQRGASGKAIAWSALALTMLAIVPRETAARSAPVEAGPGAARARVTHVDVSADDGGLFTTHATLETIACRTGGCPGETKVTVYGGTLGSIHQEVVGMPAPREGDELEVTFDETTGEARLVAP
jgi:hypothetical protein